MEPRRSNEGIQLVGLRRLWRFIRITMRGPGVNWNCRGRAPASGVPAGLLLPLVGRRDPLPRTPRAVLDW